MCMKVTKNAVGYSRREDPYDNTVPYHGKDREEDIEYAEHVVEEGIGGLEGPPEGVDILEVLRGSVVAKHLHLVACGRRYLGPRTPGCVGFGAVMGERRKGSW